MTFCQANSPDFLGEVLHYSAGFRYFAAGNATLSMEADSLDNEIAYLLTYTIKTNSFLSNFYKIKDKIYSWLSPDDLSLRKTIHSIREGHYKINHEAIINGDSLTISGKNAIKLSEKIQFGRARHRIIYFVGKQKKITIKDLLSILQITKQSLSRVLNQLVKEKYILVSTGEDKRTKNLSLTKKGYELENRLSTIQIRKIKKILINANEDDINGFKTILYEMIDDKNKIKFDNLNC